MVLGCAGKATPACLPGIIGPATVGGIKPGCLRIGNTGGMSVAKSRARAERESCHVLENNLIGCTTWIYLESQGWTTL